MSNTTGRERGQVDEKIADPLKAALEAMRKRDEAANRAAANAAQDSKIIPLASAVPPTPKA